MCKVWAGFLVDPTLDWGFLIPLCKQEPSGLASALFPLDLGARWSWKHEAHAVHSAMSNKVLHFWSGNLMSSASIYEWWQASMVPLSSIKSQTLHSSWHSLNLKIWLLHLLKLLLTNWGGGQVCVSFNESASHISW